MTVNKSLLGTLALAGAAALLAACGGSSGTGSSNTTGTTGGTGGGTTTSTSGTGTGGGATSAWKPTKVFLILMENHNWADIKASSSATYINSLLTKGSHAEQYYNPPGNHPSLPNYLWLEAGTNFGIGDDGDPSAYSQTTTSHLVTQLEAAGHTWKSYQEDISGTDCPLVPVMSYAPRHNPPVYFQDVTDKNSPTSAHCIAHVRPYTELATDLAADNVADYNFITPNLCDDMHDSCAPLNDNIKQGDTWLSTEVPKLLASKAVMNGAVVLITWDEGELGLDGPIGMIALGNDVKVGYASNTHWTHSSTLRTMQEIFGLSPFLGDAAKATDLADLFMTPLP